VYLLQCGHNSAISCKLLIGFYLLLQFNIHEWLDTAGSSSTEQEELLGAVYQGLLMCGSGTESGADVLLEVSATTTCII